MPEPRFEIAHVLCMDAVGYSKMLIDDQREVIQELKQLDGWLAEAHLENAIRSAVCGPRAMPGAAAVNSATRATIPELPGAVCCQRAVKALIERDVIDRENGSFLITDRFSGYGCKGCNCREPPSLAAAMAAPQCAAFLEQTSGSATVNPKNLFAASRGWNWSQALGELAIVVVGILIARRERLGGGTP